MPTWSRKLCATQRLQNNQSELLPLAGEPRNQECLPLYWIWPRLCLLKIICKRDSCDLCSPENAGAISSIPDLQPDTVKVLRPADKTKSVTVSVPLQPAYPARTTQAPVTHRPIIVLSFLMLMVLIQPLDLIKSVSHEAAMHISHWRRKHKEERRPVKERLYRSTLVM